MKMRTLLFIVLGVFFLSSNISAGAADAIIQSFENRPGYVRPLASLLGTAMNAGWYQSAHISKHFGFYIGIPMTVAYVGENDLMYTETYTDPSGNGFSTSFKTPTILGTKKPPDVYRPIYDISNPPNVVDYLPLPYFNPGMVGNNQITGIPFAALQIDASYYYTTLKLRYSGAPGVKGINVNFPGIGIQHDLTSFIKDLPVSVSVGANMTFIDFSISPGAKSPGDSITGTLSLGGMSSSIGALAGYRWKRMEVFLDVAWEHTEITSSGDLHYQKLDETLSPRLSIIGRNNFNVGLNLAYDLGWMPVIGSSLGNCAGSSATLLAFKYSKD